MKFKLNLVILACFVSSIVTAPPTVSVNYTPKKQWKLSKHDLADIKLDIEAELRQKILQVQMEWENRQRMEQNYLSNSGTMNQPFYVPPPMNGNPYMPGPDFGNPNFMAGIPGQSGNYNPGQLILPQVYVSGKKYRGVNFMKEPPNEYIRSADFIDKHIQSAVSEKTIRNVSGFMKDLMTQVNDLKSQVRGYRNEGPIKDSDNKANFDTLKKTSRFKEDLSDIRFGAGFPKTNKEEIKSGLDYIMKKYVSKDIVDKVDVFLDVAKSTKNYTALNDKKKFKKLNEKIDEYIKDHSDKKAKFNATDVVDDLNPSYISSTDDSNRKIDSELKMTSGKEANNHKKKVETITHNLSGNGAKSTNQAGVRNQNPTQTPFLASSNLSNRLDGDRNSNPFKSEGKSVFPSVIKGKIPNLSNLRSNSRKTNINRVDLTRNSRDDVKKLLSNSPTVLQDGAIASNDFPFSTTGLHDSSVFPKDSESDSLSSAQVPSSSLKSLILPNKPSIDSTIPPNSPKSVLTPIPATKSELQDGPITDTANKDPQFSMNERNYHLS